LICAVKGYRLILTMPTAVASERRSLLLAYGAQLELTPEREGMGGAIRRAEELLEKNPHYLPLQQFKNPANSQAHRETTAQEILEQMEGKIDAFVAGVGTGGTITGVGEILKKELGDVQIVAVEPAQSPVLSGENPGPHRIQGLGAGFIPEILEKAVIDRVIQVRQEDAEKTCRRLAKEEGLLTGVSSGAAAFAALQIAGELGRGKSVVVLLPDSGERYMSTGLFQI